MRAPWKRDVCRAIAAVGPAAILAANTGVAWGEGPASPAAGEGAVEHPEASAGEKGANASRSTEPEADIELVTEVLPSGMRVFIERDPDARRVAARAAWGGGRRLETPEWGGIHHVLSRTLTSGCADKGAAEVAQVATELDAAIRGFSTRDGFGLRAEWPARTGERGLELFADCVLAPRFERAGVAGARRRALDELRARRGEPEHQAFRLFAEAHYGDHPYALDPLGSPASLDRLSRSRLRAHYRQSYPLAEMTLAIVGDVDPDEVLADVRARFGAKASSDRPRGAREDSKTPALSRSGAPREVYRYLDADRAVVVLGFPGASLGDADRYALEVLSAILDGPRGRLAEALREEDVAPYDFGAVSVAAVEPGFFALYVACRPDRRHRASRALERALQELEGEAAAAAELRTAKGDLVSAHRGARQRSASRAAAISLHEAYGLGYENAAKYGPRVKGVSAADLARVEETYLDRDRAIQATVTPLELTPEAARRLRRARDAEGAP